MPPRLNAMVAVGAMDASVMVFMVQLLYSSFKQSLASLSQDHGDEIGKFNFANRGNLTLWHNGGIRWIDHTFIVF
jgi:hypothetical protein